MTQAGCYQLVLDRNSVSTTFRTVRGEWPQGIRRPTWCPLLHAAAAAQSLRHLKIELDFEDWCQWAVRAGLRPEIRFPAVQAALLMMPTPHRM